MYGIANLLPQTVSIDLQSKTGDSYFFLFSIAVADLFKRKTKNMGIVLGLFNPELSDFQKKKLLYEFHTFFGKFAFLSLSV